MNDPHVVVVTDAPTALLLQAIAQMTPAERGVFAVVAVVFTALALWWIRRDLAK